ncbi:MAG: division/cell wall cluster transcriptional repressor MraZ [Acidobacteria bacterium]|nr:division/cell wall cluster transcriptional repressor MraZ [Acidobacteriota bacterium]
MFRGSAAATVDGKGRLKIPAAYLAELREFGDEVFVTTENTARGRIYPMKVWHEIEKKAAEGSMSNPAKQKFLDLTSFYGHAVSIDKQGRVLMPGRLREAALIKGEVDVLGKQRYLEIWNHARFEEHINRSVLTSDDLKSLDDLGI